MEGKKSIEPIDFTLIVKSIANNKKIFFITLPIVFVLGCLILLSIPRYYNCQVKLAPEVSMSNMSGLSSIASTMGIDITSKLNGNQDAISPELYPDLMRSMDFRVSLFNIQISTKDTTVTTDYYSYLKNYQKIAWWDNYILKIKKYFEEKDNTPTNKKINPFYLTKDQNDIAYLIGDKVKCAVDKKTNVISINVTDQDPLVAATIADSVSSRLQAFITEYRTKKARKDLEYIKNLYKDSRVRYEKARKKYGEYGDANMDLVLESYKLEQVDLENDMQLQYNSFSSLATQYMAAKAKVQERTPVFTMLQSPSVPIKPAGPKRMILMGILLIITFVILTFFSVLKTK